MKENDFKLPYEKKVYSQNGEDGIIETLITSLVHQNQYCIEVGFGVGTENNTRNLIENFDYKCLAFDMEHNQLWKHKFLDLRIKQVTVNTASEIVEWHKRPDFFSLDIDSIDYYLLKALMDKKFKPKTICLEYNAWLGPTLEAVVHPDAFFSRGKFTFGASLQSFKVLLDLYGYKLFTVNTNGVNAFFYLPDQIDKNKLDILKTFEYADHKPKRKIKVYPEEGQWENHVQKNYLKNDNEIIVQYKRLLNEN